MDRKLVYPGAIPQEVDILQSNKYAMIGLAKLAAAILGTSTALNGLACSATAPASMQVSVAAGEIYSLQNIDGTAYSSLAADTTHSILKQGILLDPVLLSCPAPATAGQSINYLVQVAYADTDGDQLVLPYYNASNPQQAYSGPNNSGAANYTTRKGVCNVTVKAGVAAATGSQATPAADAGYVGAYVVTVANGQTTIIAGNITVAAGAPFLTERLGQKISQTTADARYLTLSSAASTYLTIAAAVSQYLSIANAAATYLTQGNAAATYRTAAQVVSAIAASISGSFGGSGYMVFPCSTLPNGIWLQYGITPQNSSANTGAVGNYPAAFPNQALWINGCPIGGLTLNPSASVGLISRTQFNYSVSVAPWNVLYFAIGT